ncbi:MAG: hypothetical protein JSV26_11990 [bacterium]|nr:MAG: hypothetical protein JSV26_11990 [bacterium]
MDKKPGIQTKISRPALTEILPRERLFQRLDRAREKPVIWLSGPAGSGKSTLVNSYIDDRRLTSLWYRVDPSDSDIASFFHMFALAGEPGAERSRATLPGLNPQHTISISGFSCSFFDTLFSQVSQETLIVIDSIQDVGDQSLLDGVILDASSMLRPGQNIILISRKAPSPAFAQLQVYRRMDRLEWTDLKLDRDEFSRFIEMIGLQDLPEESLQGLFRSVDGWIAGLLVLGEFIKMNRISPGASLFPLTNELFDFFSSQILDRQEPEVREFLLKTSLMPVMNPRMAEDLTGIGRPRRILEYLHKNHLFLDRYSEDPPLFLYHNLFRKFLLQRAQGTFSPKQMKEYRSMAGRLLRDSGFEEESLDLLKASGDWNSMAEIVGERASYWLQAGQYLTLKLWLDSFPADFLEREPSLLYWQGRNALPIDRPASRRAFQRAFDLSWEAGHYEECYPAWSGLVSTFVLYQVDMDHLDALIDRFAELESLCPQPEDDLSQARIAASMFSAMVFCRINDPELGTWMDRAFDLSQRSGSINLIVWSLFTKSLLHRFRGDLKGFSLTVDLLRRHAKASERSPYNLVMIKALSAIDYCFKWDRANCLREVDEGLEAAGKWGVQGWDHLLYGQRLNYALAEGDWVRAWEVLVNMGEQLEGLSPFGSNFYYFRHAWYLVGTGDLDLALHFAEVCRNLSESLAGFGDTHAQNIFLLALINFEMDRVDRAEEYLDQTSALGEELGNHLVTFLCLLLRARIAFKRGDDKGGDDHLAEALATGRREGFFYWHLFQPSVMSRLCGRALGAGIETNYVRDLIRRHNLVPVGVMVELEAWPWPVKIYTLGRFEVLRDEEPLESGGGVQNKPLELLRALIALGGTGVKEEQVVDALWPDLEGDAGHRAFTTTLHRLRSHLGRREVIKLRGGLLSLDPELCWVDRWALESWLDRIDTFIGSRVPGTVDEGQLEIFQLGLDLYKGPFLISDVHQPWATSSRERLRSRYLRILISVGQFWERMENWESASNLYLKALEVDDLAEDVYRRLMSCYQRMGRQAEAVAVCHRCMNALSRSLEMDISPETRRLCDEIREGG